ncbi:Zinc knuckle [Popillia japonica]|uniref:Zinc knuckle n=1 Tax=Popillia japonica TaxID=7064 RepID=A0AAW1LS72_POPJA
MQNVHTKPHAYTKSVQVTNLSDNKKTENDNKCYNCNEYGHISLKCPKPQRKARCFKCQKVGHLAKDCALQPPRNVNCIGKVETLKDPYHKFIYLNNKKIDFIDLGSEVVTLKHTDAKKIDFIDLGSEVVTLKHTDASRLRCTCYPCQVRLRGFGGGECQTIGRCEYTIMDFVYDCQADTIIIGRSALDQPNIKVTKERQTLTIEKIRGKWGNEENDPIEHQRETQLLEEDNGLDRNNNTHELEKMDDTGSPVTNIESMYEEEQVDGGPRKTMNRCTKKNRSMVDLERQWI